MRKTFALSFASCLAVLAVVFPLAVAAQETYIVDLNKRYQKIDNFSASDAWRTEFVGKYWPEEKRNEIADLLFSHSFDEQGNPKGMALSAWRVNIGAGSYENRENHEVNNSWNRVECFLSPDGSYDFSKARGQQWFMRAARDRGTNSFVFFSNSAPYFMTRSGSTRPWDDKYINLRDDQYDDFADFLVQCANHFQQEGYNIDYISPINEPNGNWAASPWQEGSFALEEDIYKVTCELDKAISANGSIHSKIIIPEMGNMKYLFPTPDGDTIPDDIIQTFFTRKGKYSVLGLKNLYPCVAAHDYWSVYPPEVLVGMRERIASALQAEPNGVGLWASEYCILEKNDDITMPPSPRRSINLGLFVARIIHYDLAVAGASAWQWWTAVAPDEDSPIMLRPLRGSHYESLKYDGEICPTKMLWASANYSFFIRPGMYRVDVRPKKSKISNLEAATDLMVSAYTNDEQTVVVYVNYTESDRPVNLQCGKQSTGKVYITSTDQDLQYAGTSKLNSLVIPARSVVTIVL